MSRLLSSRGSVLLSCIVATLATIHLPWNTASAQVQHEPRAIFYDSTRLATYPTQDLIDLLSEPSFKQNVHSRGTYNTLPPDRRQLEAPIGPDPRLFVRLNLDAHALDFTSPVEQQLIARRPITDLIGVFASTTDQAQQAWMVDVLSQTRGPEADSSLRRFFSTTKDRLSYLALKYFALACDTLALATLNANYMQYPVPSIEWASIVRSFGECRYRPAVPHLVESLTALMLDLGYASHRSLLALFPEAAIDFRDPVKAQKEWRLYVAAHR